MTASYGLRLIRTVSGSRENIGNLKRIDSSVVCKINEETVSVEDHIDLGAGKFGKCKSGTFHQYTVCIKTVSEPSELYL